MMNDIETRKGKRQAHCATFVPQDPGFSGTLRDFVNQGEKLKLFDSADQWMAIRELRNISAHEYSDKDLVGFFKRLKQECPLLLNIKQRI